MTIRGNGIPGEKEYYTKSIHAISVDNNLVANLQIEQIEGDSIFMLITGDENLVNEVKYEVVGDKLYLSTFNKSRFRSNNNVIISIKTPSLEKFKFKGAGRVSINNPFRVESLKIEMDGAGDLEAGNLIVQALTVDLDGVGSIRLAGHAEKVYLKTKGAGGINASQLISKDVTARLHGIGSIRCNPTEYLDAEVRGIGSISYKNDPKRKRIRTMGIGSVSKE
jgi:hypothetical protein